MSTTRPGTTRSLVLLLVLATAVAGPVRGAASADDQDAEQRFQDVEVGSTHFRAVSAMAQSGISGGCAPARYCPDDPLTRAQLATFLARALDLRPVEPGRFEDVTHEFGHAGTVHAVVAAGLAVGCSEQRFCPSHSVSRGQLASVLATLLGIVPHGRHAFEDLDGNVHAESVLALTDAGMAAGCSVDRFCPDQPVTRAQFSTLLYRAADGGLTSLGGCRARGLERDGAAGSPGADGERLLYSDAEILAYRLAMAGSGGYCLRGDADHGGAFSPGDGAHAERLARDFLDAPGDSSWSQPDLPYRAKAPSPEGIAFARPMHAAWVYMTQPGHPDHDELEDELKGLLLAHAADPTLDFSDSDKYPVGFPGSAQNPIFETAQWFARLVKTRDMLGREVFSEQENAALDAWFHGYANWSAKWLHLEVYGAALPGRLDRDYSSFDEDWSETDAHSYDGGPAISSGAKAYTNRHASVASAMSAAANYLAFHEVAGAMVSTPDYGVFDVEELLEHSRLFVEETLRFSVYPEGFQGDFERGDPEEHDASPQQGWLYSINVLANLLEIAEYHAGRGDLSVWEFGTTEGLAGSEGVPVAGGFGEKNLHFYAWAMSRYVNGGWGRTNQGEPLVRDDFYHDVIPAAMAHRFAPEDVLLEAAWKRQGEGFPDYPESPQSQGAFPAHLGEGAKMIGLIEHAGVR